ncbi:MAG: class I SAM-dependent methyltransferase [Candidatus Taylorbacteria bacterium]|nr:class I SAM-dependent methyltransferase [Candidatus Taylorbacteria bacterium]
MKSYLETSGRCTLCHSKKLFLFLSLGHQPPSDAFLKPENLVNPEITYPLDVFFCESCTLVQLGYAVDPEILFRDYVYNTGTNNGLRKHFKMLVDTLVLKYELSSKDLAIDIGSNDGTLLENYSLHKVKILGVDPSSATSIAIEKGIPTVVDFWNEVVAKKIIKKHGRAKIITATNVFAHVKEHDSLMKGIVGALTDDGIFISESGYNLDLIEGVQYDSIYHEHLRYYSLKSLEVLFEMYAMEIIDVERISIHGGSLRIYAAKKKAYTKSKRVGELLALEKKKGLYKKETYSTFAKKVEEIKLKLLNIVLKEKIKFHRIVGIGAPAKGNTLLNYCKLDSTIIDYLAEKSILKIGRMTPGMHIPVVDEARLFIEQPECAIMLSWNIADELIPKLRAAGYKGKFIIPHPVPKII